MEFLLNIDEFSYCIPKIRRFCGTIEFQAFDITDTNSYAYLKLVFDITMFIRYRIISNTNLR